MITNLLLFFILGPALSLGLFRVFNFLSLPAMGWRDDKKRMWGVVAAEVFVLLLASPVIGWTIGFSAITSLLLLATYATSKQDEKFRNRILDGVGGCIGLFRRAVLYVRSTPKVNKTQTRPQYAAPVPAPRPAPTSTSTPTPNHVKLRSTAVRDGDEQVLSQLLAQVQNLQVWTTRSDAERAHMAQLVSATAATEKALQTAVAELKSGTFNWQEIQSHVEALKCHELPSEVAAGLDKVVFDRAAAVAADKEHVGALVTDLTGKRDALQTVVSAPVVSPEAVIGNADSALAAAAALTEANAPK